MSKSSPTLAPDYALYREAVNANDVIANAVKKHGCNAAMYKYAHIQVIPSGGANPTMNLYWWCEKAGAFIQDATPITVAPKGINTPYELTVEPKGRIFFVGLTTITAGEVAVAVAGYDEHAAGSK